MSSWKQFKARITPKMIRKVLTKTFSPVTVLPSGKIILNVMFAWVLVLIGARYLWTIIVSNPDYIHYWGMFSFGVDLALFFVFYNLYVAHKQGIVHWVLSLTGPQSIGVLTSHKETSTIVHENSEYVVIALSKKKDLNEDNPETTKKTYLMYFSAKEETK